MNGGRKLTVWILLFLVLGVIAAAVALKYRRPSRITVLTGVVLRQDPDVQKQSPVPNVEVALLSDTGKTQKSDTSGTFRLSLSPGVEPYEPVTMTFRHPDYQPFEVTELASDQIYVVRMTPLRREVKEDQPGVMLADIRVRYAVRNQSTQNIGSASKTLQVVNTGNVLCDGKPPCSPDGKWKASIGWASLDAGEGNELANTRVSCIAGPCAFTRVEYENSGRGGRTFDVSVRNWSDTATFLLEAEVAHTMSSETIRRSYPVILGSAMSFTLPSAAQGLTIEAEVDGTFVVFPLGPRLSLSWANCTVKGGLNQTKLYRCQLRAGYRFKS